MHSSLPWRWHRSIEDQYFSLTKLKFISSLATISTIEDLNNTPFLSSTVSSVEEPMAVPVVQFPIFLAVRVLGMLVAALLFMWTLHFRGGLALISDNKDHIFNVIYLLPLFFTNDSDIVCFYFLDWDAFFYGVWVRWCSRVFNWSTNWFLHAILLWILTLCVRN